MNIQKMLKQAQEMQAKLTEMNRELETREMEGSSGSGAVKLTISGKGHLLRVAIEDAALEDRELLEDLILAAHRDAKDKMDAMVNDAMSSATGGLSLPAGMKLPF
jgi:DNA-binding YbaB/EbfC family protein